MRASFADDERALLDGFAESLRRLPDHAGAIDRAVVEHDLLERLGNWLAADGWLEVADPSGPAAQPATVLAGLAEVAARRPVAVPYPLLESWLAVRLLREAGAREDLVAALTSGRRIVTVAVDQVGGNDVEGTTGWIPYGGLADSVLLLGSPDGGDVDVLLADLPLAGAWRAPAIDLATPTWVAPTSAAGTRVGRLTAAQRVRLRCLYLALQSAALVGAADALFSRTIGYLKEREQFGARLSSFQALQHQAADLLVSLEAARSLAYYAAWCVDIGAARMEDYVLTAKGFCGEACWTIAGSAIQLHGGMGMTWEGGLHYDLCRIAYLAMAGRNASECLAEAGRAAIDARAVLTPVH